MVGCTLVIIQADHVGPTDPCVVFGLIWCQLLIYKLSLKCMTK